MQAVGGASLSEETDGPTTARSDPDRSPEPPEPRSRARRTPLVVLVALCLVWLALDVVTKALVVDHLQDRPPVRLLGGAVNLIYARNSGAAFSFAEGQTVILTVVAIVVVAAIARVSRKLHSLPWAISLGLVLGGALGNLADRIFRDPAPFRGAVVDWISLGAVHGYVWPTFNVADSGLTIGVTLAVVLEICGITISGRRRQSTGR